jgi:hypothetical protein
VALGYRKSQPFNKTTITGGKHYTLRAFAYWFICLRQHGTFFFILGDVVRGAHNITKNRKNLLA